MGLLSWIDLATRGQAVEVGSVAPQAEAQDTRGSKVALATFYAQGDTLIYFYPKSDTPGCTAQACSLRDSFAELKERGIQVVGISADRPEAQARFQDKYRLPFPLLSDRNRAVAQAFGVSSTLGFFSRQSFLIREGRVIWRDLRASTREQAHDVLEALDQLELSHPNQPS